MLSITDSPFPVVYIGPMVTIDSEKTAWAARFNSVLDAADFPDMHDGRQVAVSKTFGISIRGAAKWLSGESIPKYERILEIIEKFKDTGVTYEWLMRGGGDLSSLTKNIYNEPAGYYSDDAQLRTWKLPVIDWVKAGDFTETIDLHQPGYADEWIDTTTKPRAHTFALRVKGDSMEPKFSEGMLITVEPGLDPLHGDYVIAKNGVGEATFKQLIKDGSEYYLKPLNDRYPIKPLGDGRIVGVVREAVIRFR